MMIVQIQQNRRRLQRMSVAVALAGLLALVFGCSSNESSPGDNNEAVIPLTAKQTLRVGHESTPILGVLFAAAQMDGRTAPPFSLVPFGSSGDIGYALLSGDLDAGFVETSKAGNLFKTKGAEKLKVAGAIQFPYGGTLVVRKDLNIRLHELSGRKIAASEPDCSIVVQFKKDATRYSADLKGVKLVYMPFAEMLPALEAKKVDGALVKASYALLAELQEHKILYQNWDVQAGDACCPAVLAQSEFLLLVREDQALTVRPLIEELEKANALPTDAIRRIVGKRLNYSEAALARFPVATFSTPSDELIKILGKEKCLIIK